MSKRKLLVGLEDTEDNMITAISRYTGVSQAKLIRWAIRYYGMQGPWIRNGRSARAKVIGETGSLQVGPMMTEVMQ